MTLAIYFVVAVAALVVGRELGKWIFKGKKDVSQLKRSMQTLAIALREHGLRRLPTALEEAVVGDLDDVFASIKDFATVVKSGNETILKELDGTFERCLGVKLSTPEGRAVVEAKLKEAAKAAVVVAKIVGPIAIAAV